MSLKVLAVVSPPLGGKDKHSTSLAEQYDYRIVNAGQALRRQVETGGKFAEKICKYQSRGELVPAEVVLKVVEAEVAQILRQNPDANIIFNGFPRSVPQAQDFLRTLDRIGITKPYRQQGRAILLHLDTPIKVCLGRLRAKPVDRGERCDDQEAVFWSRVEVFKCETLPMINFIRNHREMGLVKVSLPGEQPPETVFANIVQVLALPPVLAERSA